MSQISYNASLRGQLVNVEKGNAVRMYKSPKEAGKTDDYFSGPETLGTATGDIITADNTAFIEVLRTTNVLFVLTPTKVYFRREDVVTADNPNYDPSKDLDRPKDTDTTGGGTIPSKQSYPNGDIEIIVEKEPKKPTTPTTPSDDTGNQRKWLTYALYAILGIAAITLTVILVKSAKTPNVKKS